MANRGKVPKPELGLVSFVHPMRCKNILGEIDTNGDNAHEFFLPDGLDENDTFHLGTFDAFGGSFTAPSGRRIPFHSLSVTGMPREPTTDADNFLAKLDFEAIADPGDKVRECEFFLGLASVEPSRERFRWLITAYLNAVYSFFETSALHANAAFTHPETGDPIADDESLEKLRAYVKVFTDPKKPYYVKTAGLNSVVQRLYKVRAAATHHLPLSIMATGLNLPEDYHFGNLRGQGEPILSLCRDALAVVKRVDGELNL